MKSLLPFTYITSALPFPWSPMEEAPVSRSQSSPSTPLPLFFHLSITVASQPRPPRITPQAGVFCQTASREGETQREGTDRGAKLGPGMGRGRLRGLVLGAPLAGVTLHPPCTRCLITSLLIYHVWTYSCS